MTPTTIHDDGEDQAMTVEQDRAPHDGATCTKAHCHAGKKQGEPGDTCAQAAGWGTDHPGFGPCKLHFGATSNHRTRARSLAVEAEAAAILAHEGIDPLADPVEALARLATESLAMKAALAARVNALGEQIRDTDLKGAEQLRSEVVLYERALDRTARFLEMLAKLGYEDRRTRVLERDADAVEALCRGVVEALGFQWSDGQVRAAWVEQLERLANGERP